jgi:hypothetical protein
MPQVLYVGAEDEISDVIESVRRSEDDTVALVLPSDAKVFQTPLNLKLLSQFATSAEKKTALISGDHRLQRAGHDQGFPMYASVQAYERGIEVVRPHDDGGIADAPTGAVQDVSAKQPPVPPVVSKPPGSSGDRRRARLYAGIGVAVVGLLALLFISPSATITLTVAATPLSDTQPIQGGTTAPTAGQTNYVQTQIVTSQKSDTFQANPTGTQQLPATAAQGQVVIATDLPAEALFTSAKGNQITASNTQFQTSGSSPITFGPNQGTDVTVPAGSGPNQFGGWSNPIPVADMATESKGNVSAGSISVWPENPCTDPKNNCKPSDFKITNLSATTGGADQKTVGTAQGSDLQGWNNQVNSLKQKLTPQVQSDMKSKANGRTFALTATDDPQNTGLPTVSCALNPALPSEGAQFSATTITVTCQASGVTYSMSDVRNQVAQELNTKKPQNEQLATDKCSIPTPQASQVSPDGTIALNFSGSGVTCFSTPPVQGEQLKSQLACKSPDDAKQLLQDANSRRLQNIDIAQHPFGLFFLPCLSGRISINISYLQTQPPSATSPTP